jgi:hypothetical protein
MPTYVKTIIYKIKCKNPDITDIYIGHSTNLKSRTAEHKYNCNNPNSKSHTVKVYDFIRNNGGWDNWEIVIVELYPCNTKKEAEIREHYWYFELKSTLNDISPILDLENIKRRQQEQSEKSKAETKIKLESKKQERINYLEKNKDKIEEHTKLVRKEYVKTNRDIINAKTREYNQKTKERRAELAKIYYERRKANGYYVKED